MAAGTTGTTVDSTAGALLASVAAAGVGAGAGDEAGAAAGAAAAAGLAFSAGFGVDSAAASCWGNDLPTFCCSGCETGWATGIGSAAFGCSAGLGDAFSGAGEAAAAAAAGAGGAGGASRFCSSVFCGAASSFFDGNAWGSGIFSLSNAFCNGTSVAATAGTAGCAVGDDFAASGAAVDEAASCGTGFAAQINSNALNKQTWNDFILNNAIKKNERKNLNEYNIQHIK